MLLVGLPEMSAELFLKVQIYSCAPPGKDLRITQHQHLLAWEDRGLKKVAVGSVLGLPSTPALLCGRNDSRRWDATFDSLGNLGLSFPTYKMRTLDLSISSGPSSWAILEFKV